MSKIVLMTYDTVDDLQRDTTVAPGMTVKTLGYNYVGDGRAATYKIFSEFERKNSPAYIQLAVEGMFAIPIKENDSEQIIIDITTDMANLEHDIEINRQNIADIAEDVSVIRGKEFNIESRLNDVEENMADVSRNLGGVESSISTINNSITGLNNADNMIRSDIMSLNNSISDIRNTILNPTITNSLDLRNIIGVTFGKNINNIKTAFVKTKKEREEIIIDIVGLNIYRNRVIIETKEDPIENTLYLDVTTNTLYLYDGSSFTEQSERSDEDNPIRIYGITEDNKVLIRTEKNPNENVTYHNIVNDNKYIYNGYEFVLIEGEEDPEYTFEDIYSVSDDLKKISVYKEVPAVEGTYYITIDEVKYKFENDEFIETTDEVDYTEIIDVNLEDKTVVTTEENYPEEYVVYTTYNGNRYVYNGTVLIEIFEDIVGISVDKKKDKDVVVGADSYNFEPETIYVYGINEDGTKLISIGSENPEEGKYYETYYGDRYKFENSEFVPYEEPEPEPEPEPEEPENPDETPEEPSEDTNDEPINEPEFIRVYDIDFEEKTLRVFVESTPVINVIYETEDGSRYIYDGSYLIYYNDEPIQVSRFSDDMTKAYDFGDNLITPLMIPTYIYDGYTYKYDGTKYITVDPRLIPDDEGYYQSEENPDIKYKKDDLTFITSVKISNYYDYRWVLPTMFDYAISEPLIDEETYETYGYIRSSKVENITFELVERQDIGSSLMYIHVLHTDDNDIYTYL